MQAIGVLAGGIAHDFNNLLTGILGYGYQLREDAEVVSRHSEAVDVVIQSAERAAELTSQLLRFIRRGSDESAPVDLHAVIREVARLLQRTIDNRIKVSVRLAAACPHVFSDATQMFQVLLNLCLNARDVLPQGGNIRISTRNSGSSLVVTVTDDGPGIPDEIKARIFEPFFTTKPQGMGTGMGLAMVYGIAKNHGGTIRVETQPDRGTSFHVTLPVCDDAGRLLTKPIAPVVPKGSVLVIDDEPSVGQALGRMVRGIGYDVESESPLGSLAHYREHYLEIDAVVLDLVMPTMTNTQCLRQLRQINPSVRAVVCTNVLPENSSDLNLSSVEFLKKPYQVSELAAAVQRATRPRSKRKTV